jgi:nucleolar GTP-binding protein
MSVVMDTDELTEEQAADLAAIRARKKQIVAGHRLKKASASNRPVMPAKVGAGGKLQASALRASLGAMGIDTSAAEARLRERSQSRGRKRSRCAGGGVQGLSGLVLEICGLGALHLCSVVLH